MRIKLPTATLVRGFVLSIRMLTDVAVPVTDMSFALPRGGIM